MRAFLGVKMHNQLNDLVQEFKKFSSWEERYKHLIGLGKELNSMEPSDKVETNKVKGCQSQVWLSARLEDGRIHFSGDSDASIVKGIVALLIKVYDNKSPDEVLATPQTFIDDIGLKQHLSMSRTNGLSSMLKQISFYALAFKAKMGS